MHFNFCLNLWKNKGLVHATGQSMPLNYGTNSWKEKGLVLETQFSQKLSKGIHAFQPLHNFFKVKGVSSCISVNISFWTKERVSPLALD